MKMHRLLLAIPLSLALAGSAQAAVKHHKAHHKAKHVGGSWDGVWSGAWGGRDPASIKIAGNRVVSYDYGGSTTPVHGSRVTAKTVSYNGKDSSVVMTRTGATTAHAKLHSTQGDGEADMTRM
jgi:hypothetical protein